MQLSTWAYHRILKPARTIANLCPATAESGYLAGAEQAQAAHIAEAIQYRPRRLV
jgi:magnesium chelatase family protein